MANELALNTPSYWWAKGKPFQVSGVYCLLEAHAKEVVAKLRHTGIEKALKACGLRLPHPWEPLSVLIKYSGL